MTRATRYPPELRERAMRLVRAHRAEHPSDWAVIQSIAGKLGMTPETLRKWLQRDAVDQGQRPRVTSSERERVRELGPGEAFGEIALLRDVPRTATVRASTDATLASLSRDHFLSAVSGHTDSATAAEAVVTSRVGPRPDPAGLV